jgi:hypothetical protein
MRDARDIIGMKVCISEREGKVHSFWITESNEIFVKIFYEDRYINYNLLRLIESSAFRYIEKEKNEKNEVFQTF